MEGTLAYISPEQTGRMNRAMDYRTDLYSIGATFYHLLTGQLPFQTSDAMELVHCGHFNTELTLTDRTYLCVRCGTIIDRDLNATINLNKVGMAQPEPIDACRLDGSALILSGPKQPTS